MAKRRNGRWSLEEKRRIVQRMESCRHPELADQLGVERRQLYTWRMQCSMNCFFKSAQYSFSKVIFR